MRTILFLLSFFSCLPLVNAQYEELTEADRQALQKEIEAEAQTMRQPFKEALLEEGYFGDSPDAILEFQLDTFQVERLYVKLLERDATTIGITEALYETEKAYDALLNKYYKKLKNKLSPEDQQVLIQAQRSWIQFRDQERDLFEILKKEEYSGGGTIQLIIQASRVMELTRDRVLNLYDYWIAY